MVLIFFGQGAKEQTNQTAKLLNYNLIYYLKAFVNNILYILGGFLDKSSYAIN